jgi:hypothetical protein
MLARFAAAVSLHPVIVTNFSAVIRLCAASAALMKRFASLIAASYVFMRCLRSWFRIREQPEPLNRHWLKENAQAAL